MANRIEITRGMDEMDASCWEAMTVGEPFASRNWYAFGERAQAPDRLIVLSAHRQARGSAAAACWVRTREQLPISHPALRALVGRYLRRRPLLSCQTAFTGRSGLYLGGRLSGRERAVRDLVRAARDLMPEYKASFVIFPFLGPEIARSRAWGDDFFSISLPPNYYLDVRWPDFESYIFSRKRSVRKDYRLHANRAVRLGLETRWAETLPDVDLAMRLVGNVERKHRAAANPWAPALIREAHTIGGTWLLVEQEEVLVGCGLVLPDRGYLTLTLLGLDLKVPQVYFALMYGALRYAIETGARGIYGGGGAETFKSRLGYRPVPNTHVRFFAANPHLRRLGRWLAQREAGAAGERYRSFHTESKPGNSSCPEAESMTI